MPNNYLTIPLLAFGGMITNYSCPSECAHCIYRCGPTRSDTYLTAFDAFQYFKRIKQLGCHSLHIGGGEPFLNPEMLLEILRAAQQADIVIEYVETNAAWFTTDQEAEKIFTALGAEGLPAVLVSISPFHNESIPYYKTLGTLKAAAKSGIHTIPWVEQMQSDLDRFDIHETHSLTEYKKLFGENYITLLPRRYWIHFGGRALSTYRPLLQTLPLDDILLHYQGGCKRELLNTSHFHVDLHGYYMPGLCIGIALHLQDLPGPLNQNSYPLLYLLVEKGINGLYEFAVKKYGFRPKRKSYLGKCDLCEELRSFLVTQNSYLELHPKEYYSAT